MTKKELQKIETSLTGKFIELTELNKEIDLLTQYYLTARIPNFDPISRVKHCPNCSAWYLNERSLVKHIIQCDETLESIIKEL